MRQLTDLFQNNAPNWDADELQLHPTPPCHNCISAPLAESIPLLFLPVQTLTAPTQSMPLLVQFHPQPPMPSIVVDGGDSQDNHVEQE